MKTYKPRRFFLFSLYQLSHAATSLAVLMAFFLILLPNSAAQNGGLPLSPPAQTSNKSDGFSFDPKLRLNPSMVIIFVCLLSAFLIMGCVSVSLRHCSQHQPDDALAEDRAFTASRRRPRLAPPRGLDSSVVDGFPIFRYSDVKELRLGKGALECAVCLSEFEDDETLRLIPKCSHVFHPDCIDAWLASHVTCPVCRANLDPIYDHDDQGADDDPGPVTHDSVPELPISVSSQDLSNSGQGTNNLGIHMHIGSPDLTNNQCQTTVGNLLNKNGKFPRSYSTGHEPVQPNKNCERFTLRLPEDVRARLINSELSRANSCVSFTRVRSSVKGFRRTNSGEVRLTLGNSRNRVRFDRVVRSEEFVYPINPAFFSGVSPTTTMEGISGEKSTKTNLRSLLRPAKSFRTPLERLFSGTERKEFDGERSFDRLRLEGNPV